LCSIAWFIDLELRPLMVFGNPALSGVFFARGAQMRSLDRPAHGSFGPAVAKLRRAGLLCLI
jgi:hypothetical protein